MATPQCFHAVNEKSFSSKLTSFSGSVFIDLVGKLTTFYSAKGVGLNSCDHTLKFKSNELMNVIMHPIYIMENYIFLQTSML